MSNALAIAATTATLRNLLIRGLPDLPGQNVTTRPLDKARNADTRDQINLFLYQTVLNSAWRNMDMPRQVKAGETGQPPLALNLYYLVTAYGNGDDDTVGHKWFGQAMSVLHDHPLLGAQEIRDALVDNDLHEQLERVRITPQMMSLEEMSKLWSAFQTNYRISAAYQVEVVLIESRLPSRTPLPVLTRGRDDSGPTARADLVSPFPTIDDIRLVDPGTGQLHGMQRRVSFELGDRVAILGHHFAAPNGDLTNITVTVRLASTRLDQPREIVVPLADRTDLRITTQIPNDPANLPAGVYLASVIVTPNATPNDTRTTNEWPILIAPRVTGAMPLSIARTDVVNGLGTATINLQCSPEVLPEQRVTVALGGIEVRAEPHPTQTNSLSFVARGIRTGDYRLRLRVDGVDSHLVDFSDPRVPRFIDALTVTIHD
jgi:hypothetical protein